MVHQIDPSAVHNVSERWLSPDMELRLPNFTHTHWWHIAKEYICYRYRRPNQSSTNTHICIIASILSTFRQEKKKLFIMHHHRINHFNDLEYVVYLLESIEKTIMRYHDNDESGYSIYCYVEFHKNQSVFFSPLLWCRYPFLHIYKYIFFIHI